jgi:hypothetical protein
MTASDVRSGANAPPPGSARTCGNGCGSRRHDGCAGQDSAPDGVTRLAGGSDAAAPRQARDASAGDSSPASDFGCDQELVNKNAAGSFNYQITKSKSAKNVVVVGTQWGAGEKINRSAD